MKPGLIIFILLIGFQNLKAEIKLPSFFGDNMVLQRNKEVKIWGWSDKYEQLSLQFNGQHHTTIASSDGNWTFTLDPMEALSTPQDMIIQGKNKVVIKNILIGDVWLSGGQSNMEWAVANAHNADDEIKNANYPEIRLLIVPENISFQPVNDIKPTEWKAAIGENIKWFSAVGYFFGKHIHKNQDIPVGLIHSNRGGSRVETWTSAERLTPFEYTHEAIELMRTLDMSFYEFRSGWDREIEEWVDKNYPISDIGMEQEWYSLNYDFKNWKNIYVPSRIEEQKDLEEFNGIIWYKKTFVLPKNLKNKDLFFRPGFINDMDETWFNGKKIGETYNLTPWRSYKIPAELINYEGENTITVRVFNAKNEGGLTEPTPRKINISTERWSITSDDLELAGSWKFKTTHQLSNPVESPIPVKPDPNDFPSSLYNGMLHPLIPFAIKGVIWYQGESNTKSYDDAIGYKEVFLNLINNWRADWNYDFEFYFVQLANYLSNPSRCTIPCERIWPYLRESQLKALNLPNTGMAVTIDAGNPYDIHPRDKQTVGYRLGLIAEAKAYEDESVVYSGPIYKSHQISGKKIIIEFEHTGSGLEVNNRYGYLKGFQIAGEDKVFHWAKAYLENDRVIVFSKKVDAPVAVRYAWEDNPEDANLYNKERLPATPFRTDNWKLWNN